MNEMNVFQRIQAVMQDVEYLAKDDKVETGGGKFYKAITEEKVTGAVRQSLIKNGLVIVPISQTTQREDEVVNTPKGDKINRITTVDVEYRIQNVDASDDFVIVASSGTGVDTQDKGVGKAMTYAYKYMLLRSFAIPTGEDPDKISSDIYTAQLYPEKRDTLSEAGHDIRAEILARLDHRKDLCDKASQKRYGKDFFALNESELSAVLDTLNAKGNGAE